MISFPDYLLIFLVPFLLNFIALPFWIAISKKIGMVDSPIPGKVHQHPVPTGGGVVIILVFYVTLWLLFLLYGEYFPISKDSLVGLSIAGAIILLLGVYDDLKICRVRFKFLFQVMAASVLCYYGFGIEGITNPFGDFLPMGFFNIPATIFWIVLMINAINLIDGLDGLAGGIIFISSCTIFFIAMRSGEVAMVILALLLAGSTLAFLRYNFHPAKVFLGDTGSMFLGLIMASISLIGNRKGTVTVTLLLPIVLMGVPLVDTIFAFFRRSFQGRNPFKNDTYHFHHRLLSLGMGPKRVVLFFYLISSYLSLTAVVLSIMPKQFAFLVLLILAVGLLIGIETLKFVEARLAEHDESYEDKD